MDYDWPGASDSVGDDDGCDGDDDDVDSAVGVDVWTQASRPIQTQFVDSSCCSTYWANSEDYNGDLTFAESRVGDIDYFQSHR